MVYNDKAYFSEAKYVTYIERCGTDFSFALEVSRGNNIMSALKSRNFVAPNTVPVTVVPYMCVCVCVFCYPEQDGMPKL